MKLYEIADNYRAFIAAVEEGEIPEEAIADTLDAIAGEADAKIDSIICLIKEKRRFAEAIAEEARALVKRQRQAERSAEWLEEYITRALDAMGKAEFESARNKVSFRRSEAVKITDEAAFIDWADKFCPDAVKIEKKASRTAISKIVKSVNLPYVVIEERKNIQIK